MKTSIIKLALIKLALGGAAALMLSVGAVVAFPEGIDMVEVSAPSADHPLEKIYSGWHFRTDETKAFQEDDFENPGFLWVEQGEALWSEVDGNAGKACETCHGDAAESMARVGAEMPKWNEARGRPVNLEQQINTCRTERMGAREWEWESGNLLAMTTFVRNQSRGEPVNITTDGAMSPWFEKGKDL